MLPTDLIIKHFKLSDPHRQALEKLGVVTLRDLLYHFPSRYEQAGGEAAIANLVSGQEVTIIGTVEKLKAKKGWKSRIPMTEGFIRDASGRIQVRWFNQPYIAKMYPDGMVVRATGKVTGSAGKLYLANPELQRAGDMLEPTDEEPHEFFAVYPETRGVTSLWLRHAIEKVIKSGALNSVDDPLPAAMLKRYNLPTLATALVWMHQPQDLKDATAAKKRFAFEEVFLIQLERWRERLRLEHEKSFVVDAPKERLTKFIDALPFAPTKAQKKAVDAILSDMKSGHPMSRLLEGDVGSGKTAVAAVAATAAVATRPQGQKFGTLQVAYMAPTEILAKQHFESFIKFFDHAPMNIGLITGSGCYKFPSKLNKDKFTTVSRTQLLKWVANGEIPILIGTHALIQKSVQFKHLALVIIDEQHRFGTNQRRKLAKGKGAEKGPDGHAASGQGGQQGSFPLPHLLSMTATPIPRTLALTLWGDLDLTLLDEMPPGRKPVKTEVVKPSERGVMYEKIRTQLQEGRQAYVICPRIDEPDPEKEFSLQAKSVKEEAKRLKSNVFPEYSIEILHSKMTPKEKDEVMARFAKHEIDILVATSVVEVGVNVPNATVIVIEGAERFGLSQLHQLRGRVVRSTHQAYCYAVPESRGETTLARLKALTTAKNGFELAEQDLLQRGPGMLSGTKQWGISDIGMEALKNLKLVEAARTEAQALIQKDPELQGHPLLTQTLTTRTTQLHFE